MDEVLIFSGIICVVLGICTSLICKDISEAERRIRIKQDALMAKLIEIKLR